eukprot:gene2305-4486_t
MYILLFVLNLLNILDAAPVPCVDISTILSQHSTISISETISQNLPFKIPTKSRELVVAYPDVFCFGCWDGSEYLALWIYGRVHGETVNAVMCRDDRWIGLIDCVIPGGVLVLKDENDASSETRCRPCCSLYYNNALFIRYEAKYSDSDILRTSDKFMDQFSSYAVGVFPLGHESIIGITSSVNKIQLYLISFDVICQRYVEHVIRSYSVDTLGDRVRFIVDVMKLLRWVITITGPTSTDIHLFPDVRMKTTNGHHVTWLRDGLLKEFNSRKDLSVIVGITIREAKIKNLIISELVVEHIRLGLNELHAIGLAHCDVFIKNVFFDVENCCDFLSDLEYLTPVNDAPPNTRKLGREPTTALELDEIQFEEFKSTLLCF